tara:strand:- start:10423 stop:11025 length:603 start_codon:yes stop_codon:yes gene_type:complete
MIGILNYGAGNVRSLQNALLRIEQKNTLVNDKKDLIKCSKLIIPGVGSYFTAITKLKKKNMINSIKDFAKKKPVLGICLGMQILSKIGLEEKKTNGLDLIDGKVVSLYSSPNKRFSHVGWNEIHFKKDSKIFKNLKKLSEFYFLHSFHFVPKYKKDISSNTIFKKKIVSSVEKKNIFGVQFHPEKSHDSGLILLENFCKL